ncbi:MAG: MMPL family transporter [Candidatus Hadarchaeales archaeon]
MLVALLSVASVWRPWGEVNERTRGTLGWVSEFTRGLDFGVDIVGGSRVLLSLQASHLVFQFNPSDLPGAYEEVVGILENGLQTRVLPVDEKGEAIREGLPYDRYTGIARVEVGLRATEGLLNLVENLVGGKATLLRENVKNTVCSQTRNEVIEILKNRVDPLGTRGAVLKPLGGNLVLYEIPGLQPQEAEVLLGKQGRLEIWLENEVLLYGEHILRVDPPRASLEERNAAELPFRLTDEGADRFREGAAGKANYPTVVYVDRPTDAVLLVQEEFLSGLPVLEYEDYSHMFRARGFPEEGGGYYLQVPAAVTSREVLSVEALSFLEEMSSTKFRILLVGEFSEGVVEGLPPSYSVENVPRPEEGTEAWIREACGCKSVITISPSLAQELLTGRTVKDLVITVSRASGEEAMREARTLRTILSQRLPVGVSVEGETVLEARLGTTFLKQLLWAGLFSFLGVGGLVFLRYRRPRVTLAVMGTMILELVITLGVVSLLPYSLNLAELAGVVLVIGTGVDAQIIITDEVVRGGVREVRAPGGLRDRVRRAFRVIWGSSLTTLVAMLSLATLGFGEMRGFALITILGILLSVLLTRPLYARMVNAILGRGEAGG